MKLLVFDRVQGALERYNVQTKKALERAKTEKQKKTRVQLKKPEPINHSIARVVEEAQSRHIKS